MHLWWLSFVTEKKPVGEQFLGVAIVEAADIATAVKVAWARCCNPGGQVSGMQIDPEQRRRLSFDLPIDKLLGPAEARELADRIAQELVD